MSKSGATRAAPAGRCRADTRAGRQTRAAATPINVSRFGRNMRELLSFRCLRLRQDAPEPAANLTRAEAEGTALRVRGAGHRDTSTESVGYGRQPPRRRTEMAAAIRIGVRRAGAACGARTEDSGLRIRDGGFGTGDSGLAIRD